MEIEARFVIADAATFRGLKSANHLGGFALSKGKKERVHDTFLDTRNYTLLAAGYSCRQRQQVHEPLITVKEVGSSGSSISKREELEVTLNSYSSPAGWPPGPVRNLILSTTDREPLVPFLELRQTRFTRQVTRGACRVAELSLDRVRFVGKERLPPYLEVECELKQEGTEGDLDRIAENLERDWKLRPETLSKFERALAAFSAPDAAPGEG